ncbi:cobalamin biosynthesis protein [Swingsia samuiensis]|uniref:Cobalamin biosynthesis protein n=1 Tax=Swingsia samuiensis TaxID=1293412 RepID=A0A4Y6UNX4_9PROT|nr:cobalamin biosynthesis protein [Swingsia samuiensis]QDH17755.1 cobalamin biosynthesis protein [Swingsia samuiensis]
MIIVGLGSRKIIDAQAVIDLIEASSLGLTLSGLAVPFFRKDESAFLHAAKYFKLDIFWVGELELHQRQEECFSYSDVAFHRTGLGAVAEACALAGAGKGSTLLVPLQKGRGVTAALALASLKN